MHVFQIDNCLYSNSRNKFKKITYKSKMTISHRCLNLDFIKIICYLNHDFIKIFKIAKIIRPECRGQRYEGILGTRYEGRGTRKICIPLGMLRSVEKAQSPTLKIGTHSYGMRTSHMDIFSTERYSLTGINLKRQHTNPK